MCQDCFLNGCDIADTGCLVLHKHSKSSAHLAGSTGNSLTHIRAIPDKVALLSKVHRDLHPCLRSGAGYFHTLALGGSDRR